MRAFNEAKQQAHRDKQRCISDAQKELVRQDPRPEGVDENWDSIGMTGDGFADQVRVWDSTQLTPRDPCGLSPGGVRPAYCDQPQGGTQVGTSAGANTPAAASAGGGTAEEGREPASADEEDTAASLPEGGSCDPTKVEELARKYAKAYNIILAVHEQKVEDFGCGE